LLLAVVRKHFEFLADGLRQNCEKILANSNILILQQQGVQLVFEILPEELSLAMLIVLFLSFPFGSFLRSAAQGVAKLLLG